MRFPGIRLIEETEQKFRRFESVLKKKKENNEEKKKRRLKTVTNCMLEFKLSSAEIVSKMTLYISLSLLDSSIIFSDIRGF